MNKTTIMMDFNDEFFLLESDKPLTEEVKESLSEMAIDFFDVAVWGEEEFVDRFWSSNLSNVELFVEMANEEHGLNLTIREIDFELYVAE